MLFVDRLAEERREGFAEGKAEGKVEGKAELAIDLYKSNSISADTAATELGITPDEFLVLVNED